MSVSFQKSLEAKEGMRETLEAAETLAPIAAPIAAASRVIGNVAAAVITPVINNVCNFNSETAAFCKGLVQPAKDLAERMAAVPDSLKTDYGFSEEEAKRFHEATGDVFTAAAVAIPFIKTTSLRVSHKVKYGAMNDSFIGEPKEYWGTLKRDLILVRFGREMDSGFKTTVWWTTPHEINPLATMEKVEEYAAILSRWGKKTHVTLAKIPAGEPIRFLHGRAAPQVAFDPFEFKLGGMVQYQFYDFDPKWICKTEPLIKPPSGVFWTRRMIVAPIISDEDEGDLVEKTRDISPASYFKYAKVEMQPRVVPDLNEEGDCITEALNRMSIEEQAAREFEREIREFCGYLRGQAESEDRARDRVRLQGALSDAALAAQRFGAPRLGALFQAGHEMIRLEESVRRVQEVGSFASIDGALAIGSIAGTGMAVIGAFASLNQESEDVFGPLMQGIREYNASLCSQVQEICRQVAYFHAETMWEFGRVRNELFSMYEELKAIQIQVTKETEFLKQDGTIGFLRVQRELDFFKKEIGYQIQELRLEELRQVEDGINHYEFGMVSLDKVREWARVIERSIVNPPFKKMMTDRTIGFLAKAAKGMVEIEDASMDALISLDTLEALLPAYVTVLKILREADVAYDSEDILWQKIVLDPVNASEALSNKLEEKQSQIETTFAHNLEAIQTFREHLTSYRAQITRIQRNIQEKKKEIKAIPCVMKSAEEFSSAATKLDESERLLSDKLQALIAELAAFHT